MSNIYIQEPPTSGKVLLVTSVGDIEVELWSKETPRACRNFVQLCLEGYYDGTIFHRVVRGFIAQGGDPTGTGEGGQSIYGAPFKDEFHSRLRFVRRGLVAMASGGADDNGSQFFFTLGSSPDLQNKHTIFGKVAGDTLYNMLRLEEGLVDADDRPLHPHRIISTQVLVNPFDDIVPRTTKTQEAAQEEKKPRSAAAATKNFKLLSFGEEAEEEEEELMISKGPKGRSKSSHDLLTDDATLSSVPAVVTMDMLDAPAVGQQSGAAERLRQRFKNAAEPKASPKAAPSKVADPEMASEERNHFEEERQKASAQRIGEIRKEFRELRRQMRAEDKAKVVSDSQSAGGDADRLLSAGGGEGNELMQAYRREQQLYAEKQKKVLPKGALRQQQALEALARFQAKMAEHQSAHKEGDKEGGEEGGEEEDDEEHWLAHQLHFEEQGPVLAKDASAVDAEEAYSIDDPRNAMNQRRRKRKQPESSSSSSSKKQSL
ncbi:spliceosome-associated protein CWC27 homolog [Haemaphysalis longicornis]